MLAALACDVKPDLLVSQADQQDPQLPLHLHLLPLALLVFVFSGAGAMTSLRMQHGAVTRAK